MTEITDITEYLSGMETSLLAWEIDHDPEAFYASISEVDVRNLITEVRALYVALDDLVQDRYRNLPVYVSSAVLRRAAIIQSEQRKR